MKSYGTISGNTTPKKASFSSGVKSSPRVPRSRKISKTPKKSRYPSKISYNNSDKDMTIGELDLTAGSRKKKAQTPTKSMYQLDREIVKTKNEIHLLSGLTDAYTRNTCIHYRDFLSPSKTRTEVSYRASPYGKKLLIEDYSSFCDYF